MCDLKAIQINIQHCLIQELILSIFKPGHNKAEATKNIYCLKGEIDYSNQMVQETLGYKNLNDQARSSQHLTVQCGLSPSQPH